MLPAASFSSSATRRQRSHAFPNSGSRSALHAPSCGANLSDISIENEDFACRDAENRGAGAEAGCRAMFVRVKKSGLRIPLPRRERPRGRPPCTARHQGAWPARRGRGLGLIDGLIASAARHSRRSIVLSSFYRGDCRNCIASHGPDLCLAGYGRKRVAAMCSGLVADRRFSFDVERAVYLAVLHRLMISGSDRHADDWCSRVRVPGAEGLVSTTPIRRWPGLARSHRGSQHR